MLKIQAIPEIWQRLSKKEKIIAYVVLSVVSLMLVNQLILRPVFSKLKSLDKSVAEQEAVIAKSLQIIGQKEMIATESAKYASFLTNLKLEGEEAASVLKEIENIANKTSVYLIDMKPAGSQAGAGKYLINLNCEGQMEQIMDFMYNIENSSLVMVIEKYQITPKAKESSVARCSMTVAKIVIQ